jgi:hypothetical protein
MAAQESGAAVRAVPAAPDAELTLDTALLGRPDAPDLVVIASGTHGVEGYGGAACQLHFMQYWSRFRRLDDVAFLLVHAVNPWGYFHDRRVTQEGVDLNRNFVADFTATPRSGYAGFHRLLVTDYRPLPAGIRNELRLLRYALDKKSREALKVAVSAGQYTHPDGLFYGGAAPTKCRIAWETLLREHVAGRRRSVLIDLHTGLGKRGSAELISYLPPWSADFQAMNAWFHGDLHSMQAGSVTAPVVGTLTEGFDRLVPGKSFAIGLEFGTAPALQVLNAMRMDHWVRLQEERLPLAMRERARRRMKRAFCVQDPVWHAQITAGFDRAITGLLDGLRSGVGQQAPAGNHGDP